MKQQDKEPESASDIKRRRFRRDAELRPTAETRKEKKKNGYLPSRAGKSQKKGKEKEEICMNGVGRGEQRKGGLSCSARWKGGGGVLSSVKARQAASAAGGRKPSGRLRRRIHRNKDVSNFAYEDIGTRKGKARNSQGLEKSVLIAAARRR